LWKPETPWLPERLRIDPWLADFTTLPKRVCGVGDAIPPNHFQVAEIEGERQGGVLPDLLEPVS